MSFWYNAERSVGAEVAPIFIAILSSLENDGQVEGESRDEATSFC